MLTFSGEEKGKSRIKTWLVAGGKWLVGGGNGAME
jgi:hypothetical protein